METELDEPLLDGRLTPTPGATERINLDDSNEPTGGLSPSHGSSVGGAIFNFSNSIIGAGAIGLGGAIAKSGGIISIASIIFFAFLTKLSLDLLIRLSVETSGGSSLMSYEDLAYKAYGKLGKSSVILSKGAYAFGCLVAYVIVVRDNFGPAIKNLIFGEDVSGSSLVYQFLGSPFLMTWTVSTLVMLPLCLLRDMTPLAGLSVVSIASMFVIVGIVAYLYFDDPGSLIRHSGEGRERDWFKVEFGYLECLGTFLFTFVSQHTVHMTFESLKPELRTYRNWTKVSSWSLFISAAVSLGVSVLVYLSFWEETQSDIFDIYPGIPVIDGAKILLCITMLLTFPIPFFTCRELLIVTFYSAIPDVPSDPESDSDLEDPLLENNVSGEIEAEEAAETLMSQSFATARSLDFSILSNRAIEMANSALLPGQEKQLKLPYHIGLTLKLWAVATGLAIASPSLGDILDLVGCASGTLIAFVFPAMLAFKLQGFSFLACIILLVGGVVGLFGTYYSLKQLLDDVVAVMY